LAVFVLSVLPLPVALYFYLGQVGERIGAADREAVGAEYLKPAGAFLHALLEARAAFVASLNPAMGFTDEETRGHLSGLQNAATLLEGVDLKHSRVLDTGARVSGLREGVDRITRLIDSKAPGEAIKLCDSLIEEAVFLLGHVGASSGLLLDPSPDSHYLAQSLVEELPRTALLAERLRDAVAAVPLKGVRGDWAQVEAIASSLAAVVDGLKSRMDAAIRVNPSLAPTMTPVIGALEQVVYSLAGKVRGGVTEKGASLGLPARSIYEEGGKVQASLFDFYERGVGNLGLLVEKRRGTLARQRAMVAGVVGFLILPALAVSMLFSLSARRQVRSIMDSLRGFKAGDRSRRAASVSRDDLGQIAISLNPVLEEAASLADSREVRDRMQRSIRKLLEDVSAVAQGDLGIEAEVTADMTGAIADSFNRMVFELRRIIGDVKDAAQKVSASSRGMREMMDGLLKLGEKQASRISDATGAVIAMAHSIKRVSESAEVASKVADEALQNSRDGSTAVEKTASAMEGIRERARETAKRIRRLEESSREIGEIARVISDIAERTGILALNASIQATMAGGAGKGFAVIAEEIERLAERSAQAAKRINTIIGAVYADTEEASSAMDDTIAEVAKGIILAHEADRALADIEGVAGRLASLIGAISEETSRQAQSSVSMAEGMAEISNYTEKLGAATAELAAFIVRLGEFSAMLSASVDRFKLPGSGEGWWKAHSEKVAGGKEA
jgi:twitching motility protein PilJ